MSNSNSSARNIFEPSVPAIAVHGGAWAMPDAAVGDHSEGVKLAANAGWHVLTRGGTALQAVEEAVAVLEDNDSFDAGRGSCLNRDGRVQLDAMLMDGLTLRAGGVGCVERILNPIRAARLVLEKSPHVYFAAEGAERFAAEHGMKLCENSTLVIPRELERWRNAGEQRYLTLPEEFAGTDMLDSGHDTVGAVAVDKDGNIAAATSTGGTLNKAPGRIGDSSMIGCGCYADNESAAASTTGWGEPMMKLVLAKRTCDRVAAFADLHASAVRLDDVAGEALALMQQRLQGQGGMILLDRTGRIGMAHNTPRMAWAWRNASAERCGVDLEDK